MKKILYSIFFINFLLIFTACNDLDNITNGADVDPIIIFTYSESTRDKRAWGNNVDKAFEANDYTAKTTPFKDYGVAVDLLWNEEHNGNFLLMMFEEALYLPVIDGNENLAADWEYFILGKYPELLCVRQDSEIDSAEEAINEVLNDRALLASTKGHSELCAKLLLNLIDKEYDDVLIIPENDENIYLEEINDEVDIIVTTPVNASKLAEDGTWIPISVISDKNYLYEGVGNIPSITEVIPKFSNYLPLDTVLGIMIPFDTPGEYKSDLLNEIENQYYGGYYTRFFTRNYITPFFLTEDQAEEFCIEMQSNYCWVLYELGEAKYSPEVFSIPEP